MDGVSAAASIVSLIQAAAAIYRYGCVTYNAKAEQRRLSSAIDELKVNLNLLKQQSDRAIANPDDPWYQGCRAILTSAKQFGDHGKVEPDPTEKGPSVLRRLEITMQSREDKLSRRQIGCTARPRRLLWYWERKRFEEMIAEIYQWTEIVNTVCNYDHFTLSLDTNAHVKMGNQIVSDDMRVLKDELGKSAKAKETKALERRRLAILAWLSPLKFRERQSALLIQMSTSLSAPRLLTTEEYTLWERGRHYMLHCEGKPGAGKTLLCAAVIKHLQRTFKSRDIPILCMYLNYKEQDIQSLDNLISSLLKQLIQYEGASFRSNKAKELYRGAESESRPTLDEFYEALCDEIECYERVVIVVDALDEATPQVAPRLLQRLQRLPKEKTSVLITSQRTESERRNTLQDNCDICKRSPLKLYSECHICNGGRFYICDDCRGKGEICEDESHELIERRKVMMNIEPTKKDIEMYVGAELNEELGLGDEEGFGDGYASAFDTTPLGRLVKNNPNLKYEISEIVVEKSDGMFALAGLYMKSLRSLGLSEAQILDMLDHPPERYAFFYEQHMQRIVSGFGDLSTHGTDLGRKILAWVACTKRPLTLSELQDALAVDLDKPGTLSLSARYDRATIIRATAGLVTIDNPSERVGLNHQSAQQYFDENRDRWFPNVDAEITRTALHYLSLGQLSQPCIGEWEDKEFEDRKRDFPFLVYAYQYWGDHAKQVGSDPVARAAVIKFLSNPDTIASSTQAGWYLRSDTAADWDVRKGTNGLHVCGWFGLTFAISSLLDQELDIDSRDPYGQTPLMYACRRGQVASVSGLIDHGAGVNETSNRGNCPLFEAARSSEIEVMRLLLRRPNVDVNKPHIMKSKLTALMTAVQEGYLEAVIELVKQPKLKIAQKDMNGNTALHHAIMHRDPSITAYILESFAHDRALLDSTNWIGDSALILAAGNGQLSMVEQLLEKGADPSTKDTEGGGTALLRAIDGGYVSTVQLLLKYNASIHCLDDNGRGLLHGAAIGVHEDIVSLLLEKGLKPTVIDKNGMTPLHDASRKGAWAITTLLLDAGADASFEDHAHRTPWKVAWQYGDLSVMRVLEGKEHHERTAEERLGQYPNKESLPVWSLAYFGERDLVAKAITNRKHEIVYLCPDDSNTALHCAMLSEQSENKRLLMVQMLLDAGMSADAQNDYHRTSLHLAALDGSARIIKLLVEEGKATVDIKDKWGTTPLLTAYTTEIKNFECALLLIEAGAVIPDTKQSMKQSLFFAAIEAGSLAAVINLVQMGADIQMKNVLGYTGLQMAKDDGKVEIEQFLRRNKSMRVPEMGRKSVVEEEDEDGEEEEKRMGALALRDSPFHNPEAWLGADDGEDGEEDEKRETANVDDAVEEETPLQKLEGLHVSLDLDGVRDVSMPDKEM